MSRGPVVGIVLAAGASRRMGRAKPLLPLEGATYLERVIARLRAGGLERPLVVLGHGAAAIQQRLRLDPRDTVIHPSWNEGMLSSLQAGIRRALRDRPRADAALVALVDVPRFAPATVRALLAARERSRAPVVLPEHRGAHGHPALFGREVWAELLRPHPRRGARAVVEAHRQKLVSVPVQDPWILRDADTPAGHRRMIAADGADPDDQ